MRAADTAFQLHNSYRTRLGTLQLTDVQGFHGLSVAVNWPHRPQDIAFLLGLGTGFIARDEIKRPVGAGMCFAYTEQAAMIGMMMTHPKLQSGGLGREILSALEAQMGARALRLNATKSAWRLYHAAGFSETGRVVQYQGISRGAPRVAKPPGIRPLTAEDVPAIEQLDARVFGAVRREVLETVREASDCYVMERDGQVSGFAMCRAFGRGHLIGPLIAASDTDAIALADMFLSEHAGCFVRLDADARHTALGEHLNARGLETYDTVVPMTKGAHFGPESAQGYVYALVSQALG